jgi:hypothetical protein
MYFRVYDFSRIGPNTDCVVKIVNAGIHVFPRMVFYKQLKNMCLGQSFLFGAIWTMRQQAPMLHISVLVKSYSSMVDSKGNTIKTK